MLERVPSIAEMNRAARHQRENTSWKRISADAEPVVMTLEAGLNRLCPTDFDVAVAYLLDGSPKDILRARKEGQLTHTSWTLQRDPNAKRRHRRKSKPLEHRWAETPHTRYCVLCGALAETTKGQAACAIAQSRAARLEAMVADEERRLRQKEANGSEGPPSPSDTFSLDLDWYFRVSDAQSAAYRTHMYTDANVAAFGRNRRIFRAFSRLPWREQRLLRRYYEDFNRRGSLPHDDVVMAHSGFCLMQTVMGAEPLDREALLEEAEELALNPSTDHEFTVGELASLARCTRQHMTRLVQETNLGGMLPNARGNVQRWVIRKSEFVSEILRLQLPHAAQLLERLGSLCVDSQIQPKTALCNSSETKGVDACFLACMPHIDAAAFVRSEPVLSAKVTNRETQSPSA